MDQLIDNLNQDLAEQGYEQLPTELYKFYKKSDENIIEEIKAENVVIREMQNRMEGTAETDGINPNIGTKMVIDHYFR